MNDMTSSPPGMLRALGYSAIWVDQGIINADTLRSQFVAYTEGTDSDTAHFRHSAFLRFVSSLSRVDDATLAAIRTLDDDSQSDTELARSRLIEVIRRKLLTEAQLLALRKDPSICVHPATCLVIERELVRFALAEDASTRVREIMLASQDPEVHRIIVDCPRTSMADLEWLATNGLSKAVRNIAMQQKRREQNDV